MEGKLSVVVADDNERIVSLLSDLLRTDEDIDIVGTAKNGQEAYDIIRKEKPDVVLFEEPLNDRVIEEAICAIMEADLLIVAGTSLTIYPAAGLINYYKGNRLVLINRDETPFDHRADLVFHESMGKIFEQL